MKNRLLWNVFFFSDRFMYTHFGEVTYGVDERGEVGLLSRNIRIEAELQKQCYSYNDHEKYLCSLFKRDTFGGHIKVNKI